MSSFRIGASAALLLLLAACGFRPMFGNFDDRDAAADLATIDIEPIADRVGQLLRNNLLDRLTPEGRSTAASYKLRVTLREATQGFAIDKAEFATRAALRLDATYHLFEPHGETPIYKGRAASVSSYNILRSDYGTLIAQQDARSRGVEQIANDIRVGLGLYFARRQAGQGAPAP